ncbi:MAG: T9SS type A sorting domain-containing protein [Bacteroidia bacterium]|nr:T9SS type A sorting domain-containing protein [Bacteroidia bacterium]
MKKLVFLFVLVSILIFFNNLSTAQTPDWHWAKSAGGSINDGASSVAVDTSGNIYVAGNFSSPSISFGATILTNACAGLFGNDIFLVKYDAGGNVLWAKSAGGTDQDIANSLAVDASGNIIVAGWFQSSTIIFGTDTLTNEGQKDIFLAKYSTNGNILWARTAGGTGADEASSVATDASGNIIVAGWFQSPSIIFGADTLTNMGVEDIILAKYDTNGIILWVKRAGGTGFDEAASVTSDAVGNIYVAGDFLGTNVIFGTDTIMNDCAENIFLAKYDDNGNVLWVKNACVTGNEKATSVAVDVSGNIYLAGNFLCPTIAFGSVILTNPGGDNIFIVKYDLNGNVIWANNAYGFISGVASSVAADASGNSFLTGNFNSSTIAFGSDTLTNEGHHNIFLTKYDANGNDLWAKSAGGTSDDFAFSVAADASGNAIMVGSFSSPTITFGSISLTNILTNPDSLGTRSDMFIANLGTSNGIMEFGNLLDISVYPNPAKENIEIKAPSQVVIRIFNIQGQMIKAIHNDIIKISVNVSDLPGGVYIIKVLTDKGVAVRKFIKE